MEDHELERVAASLGANAAERLDVERVAAGVVARLRTDQAQSQAPRHAWWTAPMLLRLAAALAILVTGGVLTREALRHTAARPSAVVPVPILRELTNDELIEVFDSLGVEAPVQEGLAVGLESLNETQLKELLSLMEG
jgi:hypothetical protein